MKLKSITKLTEADMHYLAGFLDGDGSIMAQIVKGNGYKYGYTIRVTVCFYQKTTRHWFLLKLRKLLGKEWKVRKKNDGMSELYITGFTPVKNLLSILQPYFRLKPRLAKLVLEIIEEYSQVQTEAGFLEVCKKIDKTAEYTDSKKRKNTYSSVKAYLNSPVETEKSNLPIAEKTYQL
jgi:hypothetical protein|tara:strand:- start:61 stop:594 length:534 start_codon:yes stop_codon:yes gene_type:complete